MASNHTPTPTTPSFPQFAPAVTSAMMTSFVPVAHNGQTMEGILDEERMPNALLPVTFVSAPEAGTICHRRAKRLKSQFEGWLDKLLGCDPVSLDFTVMQSVYSLHLYSGLTRRDFAASKSLPKHIADDRRDPIALIVTAVQLLHDAVPRQTYGRGKIEIDRFEYVLDRLREAELVQISQNDVRFEALKALSAFVAEVVAKYDRDCCFCVEVI